MASRSGRLFVHPSDADRGAPPHQAWPSPIRRSVLNPLLRRAAHSWFLATRALTLGVRGAAIDGAGRVCLIRHTYTPGWHLPGGGVERGEDALTALGREFSEEAEIEIVGVPRLHGIFHSGAIAPRDHVLVYEIRAFTVVRPKRPDREIAACGFFPLDALPEETTPATRARLDEIATGRVPAATW